MVFGIATIKLRLRHVFVTEVRYLAAHDNKDHTHFVPSLPPGGAGCPGPNPRSIRARGPHGG